MRVAIVSYGTGNLASVAGAVRAIGFEPDVTSDPAVVLDADRIILPGVGAFADGVRQLRASGMTEALEKARRTKPVLGICLGAQMMCRSSDEFGWHEGLGWVDAEVRLLRPSDDSLRIPHVGWNNLVRSKPSILFDDIPDEALFYYVHSYGIHCAGSDLAIGFCNYGENFTAAFESGHVYGVQFHPEKSQKHGLMLLHNFIAKAG